MITIIFGPPRIGKTCFLAHTLNTYAYDTERYLNMATEIELLNEGGFNLTIPPHPVSANFSLEFYKFGYSAMRNRMINPFKLGFANNDVLVHDNYPYEVIGIMEAQVYLNSRMSAYFPDWQSRWYEQHGHNNLDIFLDCQRPDLIDLNVRELCAFIEIIDLKVKTNKFGEVLGLVWTIRKIDNFSAYEKYVASGKRDKSLYVEEKVKADYNVFSIYDSQAEKPKFYKNLLHNDFIIDYSEPSETSIDYYEYFIENLSDEVPPGFYIKRGDKVAKKL